MNGQWNYFGDGMRIFLDYIDREFIKNPEYVPHPLVRAFVCANQGITDLVIGKSSVGVSQNEDEPNSGEMYFVAIEKGRDTIIVKEIRHVGLNRSVSIEQMISIFRLQILLDRLDGKKIQVENAISALNKVVTTPKFQAVGNRWREARDEFVSALKDGRAHIPDDPKLRDGMLRITKKMDWYDYPSDVRALIGGFLKPLGQEDIAAFSVTFPKDNWIDKNTVFHLLTQHWWLRYKNEETEETE